MRRFDPQLLRCVRSGLVVSIRAPVKGATVLRYAGGDDHHVSIRAPVKGATRGGDTVLRQLAEVSIRAPVKGATRSIVTH
jgi:hypothetical protein